MKKKLCTLLITLTLTCSLLIGCGNSDTVETAPASSESAGEISTADTPKSTDESTTDAAESPEETSTPDAQESP